MTGTLSAVIIGRLRRLKTRYHVRYASYRKQPYMNIGVFCSARDINPEYIKPVRDFAKHVGEHGHTLIWGGSGTGLMKVVADGVRETGGKLVGVSIRRYEADAMIDADELLIAKDLFDRKRIMIERSDAVTILVGGVGTLDEATDIIELKRQGGHDMPLVFLNTNGFYEPLRQQFEAMEEGGFLDAPIETLVSFADNSHQALDVMISQVRKT